MDRTTIELNGHRALVADHCALCDQVASLIARIEQLGALCDQAASLTARVEQLEYLMSEEIMASLASPTEMREVDES